MYILKNNSVLSINPMFLTQSRLGTLDFNENEIVKIIRALRALLKPLIIYFKIQLNGCITQIYWKGLILYLYTKKW